MPPNTVATIYWGTKESWRDSQQDRREGGGGEGERTSFLCRKETLLHLRHTGASQFKDGSGILLSRKVTCHHGFHPQTSPGKEN